MKRFLFAILIAAFLTPVMGYPISKYPSETEVCESLYVHGDYTAIEKRLWDGTRVDLTTETEVIEVDWAYKWAEGIGQALYYAQVTGKKPVVMLLIKDWSKDSRYVYRLQTVAAKHGIKVLTHKVNKDK